ncbi:hypothetical protein [Gluconobacter sp. DsW_058]|uniref:hypothetical protein n=1 Tax=Gluconobacter sp. DsW_058 TaxID=1511210 RepID=UPI000A37C3EB|nr:hypothetical protein [Gluconobacter sp. DsW_058]OUJ04958.1 hypothetical protein HK24_13280 [Gluconobacter sp. DsW_058]
MSELSGPEFDRLQSAAIEFHGVLITKDPVLCLTPVSQNMRSLLSAKLQREVERSVSPCPLSGFHQTPGLSESLKEGTVRDLQSKLSSALLSLLKDLRLGDVKTEVLASWLTEIETSSSSSVLADGDSGDSVAADPRNNGTPDTSEKGVNGDA